MTRNLDLALVRTFVTVADCGSMTIAANLLYMTQGAVSQQIKSLESAMGRSLFLRRARGLELTDAGRGYLPTVQAAFAMLEEGTSVLQARTDPDVPGHKGISILTVDLKSEGITIRPMVTKVLPMSVPVEVTK